MPSRFTLVPGSQGPRHSGSVARATSQVFTPTERVRTMICSHGDEMSLLTTGTRRCKGNTAGVETGDSICGEKETCGHHQEYCWEHRRESKTESKHAFTLLENLKLRTATFSSHPTSHQRTRISWGSPALAFPYPCNPRELYSHRDHTQKSLCRRYLCSCLKELVASSFPDGFCNHPR